YSIHATTNGRQMKCKAGRSRNNGGGIEVLSDGFNIDWTFRDCSNWTDNTTDGVNIAPPADGNGDAGGIINGCDFTSTADTTRMRYLINIANAHMQGAVIGVYSIGKDTPATGAYGTAEYQNLGTNTRIYQWV